MEASALRQNGAMNARDPLSVRDQAAIRRWLDDGCEEAFRLLYREHTPYLYAFALRLSGGRAETAGEAVQEAWVRAARRLDRFRGASTLRTWLAGIVFNCCRELRRARPGEELPESAAAASHAPPTDARLDAERLLAALPAAQREVLLLHHFEGFTHDEIADLLAIPPGTSKRRLFDARNALRRLAHPAGGGEGERP